MFRKISLALAIAQSTVYADDHEEATGWDHHDDHDDEYHEESSAWEFIFPDEVFIDSILTL